MRAVLTKAAQGELRTPSDSYRTANKISLGVSRERPLWERPQVTSSGSFRS